MRRVGLVVVEEAGRLVEGRGAVGLVGRALAVGAEARGRPPRRCRRCRGCRPRSRPRRRRRTRPGRRGRAGRSIGSPVTGSMPAAIVSTGLLGGAGVVQPALLVVGQQAVVLERAPSRRGRGRGRRCWRRRRAAGGMPSRLPIAPGRGRDDRQLLLAGEAVPPVVDLLRRRAGRRLGRRAPRRRGRRRRRRCARPARGSAPGRTPRHRRLLGHGSVGPGRRGRARRRAPAGAVRRTRPGGARRPPRWRRRSRARRRGDRCDAGRRAASTRSSRPVPSRGHLVGVGVDRGAPRRAAPATSRPPGGRSGRSRRGTTSRRARSSRRSGRRRRRTCRGRRSGRTRRSRSAAQSRMPAGSTTSGGTGRGSAGTVDRGHRTLGR